MPSECLIMPKSLLFSILPIILLWDGISSSTTRFVSVVDALSSATTNAAKSSLKYRTAKPTDINDIAELLMDTFEDDSNIPSWNIVQRKMTLNGYQRQIQQRMEMMSNGRQQQNHALIVAVDDTTASIAGFMELGTMPSPVPIPTTTYEIDETNEVDPEIESTEATATSQQTQPVTSSKVITMAEYPFLANLAVNNKYRRQGIGTKLVQLAIKVSTKWCTAAFAEDITSFETEDGDDDDDRSLFAAMYLSVDKENDAAVQLYDNLQFRRVLDETEQVWSSKKLQRKLKERKPRLYYEKKLDISASS